MATLAAMDANGNQGLAGDTSADARQEGRGKVTQLFSGDLSTAWNVRYTSDKPLLGFAVSVLSPDGLHCLPNR